MLKGKQIKILQKCLILLILVASFFIVSAVPAYSQVQTSYIIVHCHNPEGKEIASIQGVSQNSVEIYDGDTHIGYGAYNAATHNQPITIDAGSHTIKAKFNGITLQQTINLQSGETKVLVFTFTRTEFDIRSWLSSPYQERLDHTWSGLSALVRIYGLYSNYFRITYFCDSLPSDGSVSGSAILDMNFDGKDCYKYGRYQIITHFPSGGYAWMGVDVLYLAILMYDGYPITFSGFPQDNSFDYWYVQSPSNFSSKLHVKFNTGGFYISPDILYPILLPSNTSNGIFQSLNVYLSYDFGLGISGGIWQDVSREVTQVENYYDNTKVLYCTSVPYDLTGTAVGDEKRLLLVEAKSDKSSYTIGEQAKISCKVTDTSGTTVSGAFVTAEITKPDGTAETISLSESSQEAGAYEGTFIDTFKPGNYKITLRAEKQGYTPAQAGLDFIVQPSFEILDGVDFSAGREISSDPEKLASGGTPVKGALTDGVTRLLLRFSVDKYQFITFSLQGTGSAKEDGILRSIDGFQQGSSITVNTVEVNGKQYAFAVYQAPEHFVRVNYQEEDKKTSERILPIKVESSSGSQIEEEIKLVRPPVILIHGLWSGPGMWEENGFRNILTNALSGIHIFRIDYQSTNASYFSVNENIIYDDEEGGIRKAKATLRSEGIAMVQADILGHSMSGLLSRIWAGGRNNYQRDDNFWMGDINKLITLDSPHYGSFLADVGMQFINDLRPSVREWVLRQFRNHGMALDGGAVHDLMIASEAINDMNTRKTIPASHAIVGNYIVNNIGFWFIPGDLGWAHRTLTSFGYDTRPYVVQDRSDLVVSVASQFGGLTWPASSAFGHHHMAATTEDVTNQVIELLNEEPDSDLFRVGFPVGE